MKIQKFVLLTIMFLSLVIAFSGCSSLFNKKGKQKFEKEFIVNTTGISYMFISNTNGDIIVSASSTDSLIRIRVSGVIYSKSKASPDSVELNDFCKIDTVSSAIIISEPVTQKKGEFFSFKKGEVNFNISVPSSLKLRVENKNGNIKIENGAEDINVQTVNGNIHLTELSGTALAKTTNGTIKAELDSVTTCIFESVNGKIEIGLSENFSGKIIASYVNGKVVNKDVTFDKVESTQNKYFAILGKGPAEVELETVNGKIYIRRK